MVASSADFRRRAEHRLIEGEFAVVMSAVSGLTDVAVCRSGCELDPDRFEYRRDLEAEQFDGDDDRDRDARGKQAVFDPRGAAAVGLAPAEHPAQPRVEAPRHVRQRGGRAARVAIVGIRPRNGIEPRRRVGRLDRRLLSAAPLPG